MKLEDSDSAAPEPPTKPAPGSPGLQWTPQDVVCATLFGPWDDLPCRDYHGQTPLLRDLDRAISLFDARIQHSDKGFRAWRERHKQAMEAGRAPVPGFPNLLRGARWQDDAWERRYQYLVGTRQRMMLARLESRFLLTRRERDGFFGALPAPPRATLRGRARGLVLRCDWFRPLDCLLERAAEAWDMDGEEVREQFWRDEMPVVATPRAVKVEEEEEEEKREEEQEGEPALGKMDLAFLLNGVSGAQVPRVPIEGQMC